MHLTEGGRRIARSFGRGQRRHTLSAGVAVLAAVGTLSGALVAVLSSTPQSQLASAGPGAALASAPTFGLPAVRPSTGSTPVAPGLAMGSSAKLLAVPIESSATQPRVAPLRRTVQADLLIVAPFSLSDSLAAKVSRIPGVVATERIEAVRMSLNGSPTAVLGVDPSVFRQFAAKPTGASNALWQGVADGGIAVSYTMGTDDKIKLGGTVTAAGQTTKKLQVAAFGTLGIGGVNAVVSDATARALGAPAGNAIVVSVAPSDFTAAAAAAGRLIPKGAGVEQLVSLISTGGGSVLAGANSTGAAGAGQLTESAVPQSTLSAMLTAAMSRRGLPYVWGGAGPKTFDCSGLVQWSFRQAGLVMPRVAADQALTGPSVPVSELQPGDLLFYHTDPTDPTYISHVAIYIGNGWMLQAPEPGLDVEVVPADFGSEFAGAVRVNPAQAAAVAARVA